MPKLNAPHFLVPFLRLCLSSLPSHSVRSFVDNIISRSTPRQKDQAWRIWSESDRAVTQATDAQIAYMHCSRKNQRNRSSFVWSWLNCSRDGERASKKRAG
ncbi:hypothetical protein QBC40DRAFT_272787 [Triangularia verruculosa]|uniref:Secreted protein n=1 Tax=Triangularia verruculosa TaxID=2587418 RepID=A0AAN6XTS9_9PEZI|nr:hypothetical protein QBC40DRAFT_272787 [Triangularia verruculosa]